jgi:hypothetical protein
MWNYIRPDAPVTDDPAEHSPDRPEDCEGECQDCGRPVPLKAVMDLGCCNSQVSGYGNCS